MGNRESRERAKIDEIEERAKNTEKLCEEIYKRIKQQDIEANKKEEKENDERQMQQQQHDDLKARRATILKQRPGGSLDVPDPNITFPEVLNVGLYGTTGIGKTSLINSIRYALAGKLDGTKWIQTSTEEFQGGHTIRRLKQPLTEHLTIIDNRGIGVEDMAGEGATQELIGQLEGRRRYADAVGWRAPTETTSKRRSEEADRVYCTVLVFDPRSVKLVIKDIRPFIQSIYSWQGRYPIVVITNVDRTSDDKLTYARITLQGMGISDIYEVANICEEKTELEVKYQMTLVKMLQKCMLYGDQTFLLRKEIEGDDD